MRLEVSIFPLLSYLLVIKGSSLILNKIFTSESKEEREKLYFNVYFFTFPLISLSYRGTIMDLFNPNVCDHDFS
jgi:hypothetical protein